MGQVIYLGEVKTVRVVSGDVINGFQVQEEIPRKCEHAVRKWAASCQTCHTEIVLRSDLLLMGEPSRCTTCLLKRIGQENPELAV